jgi:hypothetical protein
MIESLSLAKISSLVLASGHVRPYQDAGPGATLI